jgi:hypothetical protein
MTESGQTSQNHSNLFLATQFYTVITTATAIMAGKFEPKVPVNLDPPKDDIISREELAKANGTARPSLRLSMGIMLALT